MPVPNIPLGKASHLTTPKPRGSEELGTYPHSVSRWPVLQWGCHSLCRLVFFLCSLLLFLRLKPDPAFSEALSLVRCPFLGPPEPLAYFCCATNQGLLKSSVHIFVSLPVPQPVSFSDTSLRPPKASPVCILCRHLSWHCLPHTIACDNPFSDLTRASRYLLASSLLASRGVTGPASCPAEGSAPGL